MTDIFTINPKRILVCQLRQIGDVLLATPSIRLLGERFPEAEIHVLTEKKCVPVLVNNPRVHRIWPIDRKALANPLKALAYYASVGRHGFDLIVDFQQLPRCKWVLRFSKAPVRLSFPPRWFNRKLYTHWAPVVCGYAAKCKASVLAPLGIQWNGERPEIWLTEQERQFADALLREHDLATGPFITVDPSHRRETRRWPARHFASLIRLLGESQPDLKAMILYGPGERELAEEVASLAGDRALVTGNMLSLREMAAVQERAVLHLGNCSAPRHFAVAVDTPSLTIQGATGTGWGFPSDEHVSATKRLPCYPCNKNTCKTRECLETFLPEDLLAEALRLIAIGRERRKTQTA
ncbi:glycosyltransferase family 9 protein [Pseudodesulfovibrio sp. F-1]|uniref:Glycosyltransferase family 9 protein n=1 Tax=Pseudodesulfovibrio alkaliphilus TaxID=2661613 RepID=A0A7K1KLM5_9BACT|nr:glycosyltransferase family 9 protein [Pseudodesulfovibrio alkaliphilus]MUM76950.1 glycosyltransferase family 9 protein [Pseudodesulfovibrio alkaliphilus]